MTTPNPYKASRSQENKLPPTDFMLGVAQRRLIALILTSLWLTACGDPHIRIANRSNVPLENVRVRFPSQTEDYGTIPPDAVTEYRKIKRAYSTPYIETTVGGQQATLRPIDHVGDKLLRGGRYTYSLGVNAQAQSALDRLRFEFIWE